MTAKEFEKRHAELQKDLERFLDQEAKDPDVREMLVSLQGD